MKKYITASFFGKTRMVLAESHNMADDEEHEEILWVERPEDYYALLSPQLKDKKVAIVTRTDWLEGDDV